MKQLGHLKTYKLKLTTLSPVFIGGGEFFDTSNLQYVYDETTGELKFIDETKFLKFLSNSNYKESFIKYVSSSKEAKLSKWLNQNFSGKNLDIYSRIEKVNIFKSKELNTIKCFVKNTDGYPYIPGSSIKGAIRTALYSYLIENQVSEPESELKNQMRHIQIADTAPFPTSSLMYRQTAHQQLINEQKLMNVDNDLKEILKEGVIKKVVVTIDKEFKYSIQELLEIVANFYKKVYQENDLGRLGFTDLKNVISVEGCSPNINIGGQSGFNSKVVLRVKSRNEQEYNQKKKEILNRAFRKHKHMLFEIAPRCIKVVKRFKVDSNILMPLGWCNLSLEEE